MSRVKVRGGMAEDISREGMGRQKKPWEPHCGSELCKDGQNILLHGMHFWGRKKKKLPKMVIESSESSVYSRLMPAA